MLAKQVNVLSACFWYNSCQYACNHLTPARWINDLIHCPGSVHAFRLLTAFRMTNVSHTVKHLSFSDANDGKFHRKAEHFG